MVQLEHFFMELPEEDLQALRDRVVGDKRTGQIR
jgi:hypothetical protein